VSDVENNKQTVIAYYNMAFNERKPAEAAQKYGGPHYSPWVRRVCGG
jgi:predicted SnoaL-like aldol condensation-catalyzing enzyme